MRRQVDDRRVMKRRGVRSIGLESPPKAKKRKGMERIRGSNGLR